MAFRDKVSLNNKPHQVYDQSMLRVSQWLKRERLSLILLGLLVALSLNCLLAPRGVRDLLILRQDRIALGNQIVRDAQENHQLVIDIDNLQHNDAYIERLIRKNLGYVRSDELVYRFHSDNTASVSSH
ncbi:MAG TPA: septum formation initiator family protein [Candidatus Binataceae bacterium]|nr:septum formation initiator family protein [Candidatus Binataceae bacterium]